MCDGIKKTPVRDSNYASLATKGVFRVMKVRKKEERGKGKGEGGKGKGGVDRYDFTFIDVFLLGRFGRVE